ncbi:MAG TPA: SGNH/GDSL hydrolase family protein [Rariglobus sp.]
MFSPLSNPLRLIAVLLALFLGGAAFPSNANTPLPPELRPRDGLPHVAAKLAANGEIRVAFLGGSITAADGWRPGILSRLRQTYPNTAFAEIFAAIPGTGSDFGVARLQDQVLKHSPDLLFVEFAVNDTGRDPAAIRRSMEGIVRQTRRASPDTDLCFVYTLSSAGLPALEAGRDPAPAAAMEQVADHYGVPSINFGIEVVRRLQTGELIFAGKAPSSDVIVFTVDKTHPTPAGHRIYTDVLARSLFSLVTNPATPSQRPLPDPLENDNSEGARLVPLGTLAHDDTWIPLPANDDRFRASPSILRRPTWVAARPGPVLEFTFAGTAFGFAGLKGPDAGQFTVQVDELPSVTGTLFDNYSLAGRYRVRPWFYPNQLPLGPHHVRVTLLPDGPDKATLLRQPAATLAADPTFARNVLTVSDLILVGPEKTRQRRTD